jgi:hypothetical protein
MAALDDMEMGEVFIAWRWAGDTLMGVLVLGRDDVMGGKIYRILCKGDAYGYHAILDTNSCGVLHNSECFPPIF